MTTTTTNSQLEIILSADELTRAEFAVVHATRQDWQLVGSVNVRRCEDEEGADRRAFSTPVGFIPSDTIFKLCTASSKDVKRAANSQVDFPIAAIFHQVKIVDRFCTASICDWDATPLSEFGHQFGVNTLLQTLVVCGMNEEFRAVRLERFDAGW